MDASTYIYFGPVYHSCCANSHSSWMSVEKPLFDAFRDEIIPVYMCHTSLQCRIDLMLQRKALHTINSVAAA